MKRNTMIYLDNAATTIRKPLRVYSSLFFNTLFYSVNSGHGGHFFSTKGAKKIYDTSEAIAELLNIENPEQIAYTYNATYAINLAIDGIINPGEHIITTVMEHNSVLRTVHKHGNYTMVPASCDGTVFPKSIEAAIKPETKLIVVNHISNTSGTIQNIKAISKIAKKHNIIFMVDASQSIGSVTIDVKDMGIDILVFSAHKGFLGPLGVGILYISPRLNPKPVITGGTGSDSKNLEQPIFMPDIFQSGTMNTPAIIACKSAVSYLKKRGVETIGAEERYLAIRFIENAMNMKNIKIYGKKKGDNRNGTVLFNIGDMDSIEAADILNSEYGIALRGGWHCAYYSHLVLGSAKSGALRLSFGPFDGVNTLEKITDAVYKMSKVQHTKKGWK